MISSGTLDVFARLGLGAAWLPIASLKDLLDTLDEVERVLVVFVFGFGTPFVDVEGCGRIAGLSALL